MPLDFAVFGVPRSGTTAAAEALNLHPQIMCGMEYFQDALAASTSVLPDAFEDSRFNHSPNCAATRDTYRSKKGTARVFGNKDPRFYLYADMPQVAAPGCKKICIYRPRLEFWSSWDTRASDHSDRYWERGQTGLFGVFELLCLIATAADFSKCGEMIIVNYDSLFFDDIETIEMLFGYLGVDPDPAASARFEAEFFRQPGRSRSVPQGENVSAIYRYLQLEDLERQLLSKPIVSNREIADDLVSYGQLLRQLASKLIDSRFMDVPPHSFCYFLGIRLVLDTLARHGIHTRVQRLLSDRKTAALAAQARANLLELERRFEAVG